MTHDPKEHTPIRHFRLGDDVIAKLDALAHHYSVNRTSMLKVLIADAFKGAVERERKSFKKSPKGP